MSDADRSFTTAALQLHAEFTRGREELPTCEVAPGLWMTILVFADQSGPSLSHLSAEVMR
jgi:hypothetical protein